MRGIRFLRKKLVPSVPVPFEKPTGLIVPLLTPFNVNGSLDEIALKTITARLMNKGVRHFLVLGSASEYEYLSEAQQERILEIVSQEVRGRGQMLVACFGETADEIIERITRAQKYSTVCVVNVPFSALERELEFIDFFDSVFTQTSAQIVLYNNAFLFKKTIPALWLDNIINWERLAGVIDASRNPEYLDELGKYYQFTQLFEANEELAFDALRRGFSGIASLSALLFPAYYLSLIENFNQMDYAKMMRQEAKIATIAKLVPQNKKIQAFKYALSLQNLMQPYFSPALEPLNEKEKHVIVQAFGARHELLQP